MTRIFLRTLLMYLLLVGSIRLLGKRQVGQMGPAEFVVTMMTANLATLAIEDPSAAPALSVLAILTIVGGDLTLNLLTMKSLPMRKLLNGKPVILIENGRLLEENLRSTRVSLDELMGKLREKAVLDLRSVQYAILETDGELSVFPYSDQRPATAGEAGIPTGSLSLPVTLVEDGILVPENLSRAGKDAGWVKKALLERGACLRDTLLLTLDDGGSLFFLRKEGKT